MKQFNPLIPMCQMCGAQHWPGGPHVFINATFTPSDPVVAPVKSRPSVSPDPDQPVNSVVSFDTDDTSDDDSSALVTISPPSDHVMPLPTADESAAKRRAQREGQSIRMREIWAKRRAEAAAKKTNVPEWMGVENETEDAD